ncbi:MAG: hypothetical protein K9K39_09825 [Desulfohalobiaceae bacterium]|nr:hypothetical protein [Desulfohalobiaceae bacterium]
MWVEVITVRTARPELVEPLLRELAALQEGSCDAAPASFACYRSLDIDNEVAIRLAWDERKIPASRTRIGVLIAKWLEGYGMVHHSIWTLSLYSTPKNFSP